MAAEWEDDDFFGAECEMDDQMLINDDDEDNEIIDHENDKYEQELRVREASFSVGDVSDEELKKTILNDSLNFKYRYFHRRKDSNTLYPPERKPPIFDFFTVLTAFIAAVILAYYTISSY